MTPRGRRIAAAAALAALSFSPAARSRAEGLDDARLDGRLAEVLAGARALGTRAGKPRPEAAVGETPALPVSTVGQEEEVRRCPREAQPLVSAPDLDLFTYMGFRYVRSDATTCEAEPSGNIYFLEPQALDLALTGSATSYTYDLKAPEFVSRRNFYFRTALDGVRRFYFHDASRRTGREAPETVTLAFAGRDESPILPWEGPERFRLRYGLTAPAELTPVATAYEYAVTRETGSTAAGKPWSRFRMEAARKRARTPPDREAVTIELVKEGTRLVLRVRDRWARYYRAEALGLKIKLWRNVWLLEDKAAYELDVEFKPAAGDHDASMNGDAGEFELEPADPRWDAFKRERIEPGREYYADWSFRRANSRFSTDDWVEKGRTNRLKL